MIIVKVGKKENIERALKRFKKKFRKTQIIKKLRANQYFEKKSTKKRHQIQKAIYKIYYIFSLRSNLFLIYSHDNSYSSKEYII